MHREFVLNPDNGYWGISSPEHIERVKTDIAGRIKPEKKYHGIHIIALNLTQNCNLGCIYCSTAKNRSSESMPLEIAIKSIDQLEGLKELPQIVFHGSEPMLNMRTVKGTVEYGERVYKKSGRRISFSMQSNLTLLTKENLDLIRNYKIGISTSLDGRENEHNLNRPYRKGNAPTYNDVRKGIEKILEIQKGICAVCVVTKNNVNSLSEIAMDFENIGITEVHFLPAVRCGSDSSFMPSNKELTASYIQLFEQTFQRLRQGVQKINIRDITQYLSALFFRTGVDCCRICTPNSRHPIIGVDIDGSIYPCDFFWGDKETSLGNVNENSFLSVLNNPKNPRMTPIDETACRDCDWRNICGGGCCGDRIFSKTRPHYCETHKAIFQYLAKNMNHLLEEGIVKKIFDLDKLLLKSEQK